MKIVVTGVAAGGNGYPNAFNTIRRLREAGITVIDEARWLPDDQPLWRTMSGSLWQKLRTLLSLLIRNAFAATRLLRTVQRSVDVAYIPYPAIFLLWWLSWVPRRWRPRIVADAYVTIWDSAVGDRGLIQAHSIPARLLRAFEGRALRTANAVLVDTAANRDWVVQALRVEPGSVFTVPLAIDDDALIRMPPPALGQPLKVTYVGTFVPLHGVDVIAEAVQLLRANSGLAFQFVGDGQQADHFESLIGADNPHVNWERRWLSHADVEKHLSAADICLGVFGGREKSARVFPFKLYLALAAGRAVVSQDLFSLPDAVPAPPIIVVPPHGHDLALSLDRLALEPQVISEMAARARTFYVNYLGAAAMLRSWREILRCIGAHSLVEDGVDAQKPTGD